VRWVTKALLSLLFVLPVHAATEIQESPTLPMGGGLNVKANPSDIADEEASAMNNMAPNILGSVEKRNGTVRYNTQAVSTQPFNSLYVGYALSSTTTRAILGTSGDRLFVSTAPGLMTLISSGLPLNAHWAFAELNNQIILTPQESTYTVLAYDIQRASLQALIGLDASTGSVRWWGKFPLVSKNYFLLANVADLTSGCTFYRSRVVYSRLLDPSSFTWNRSIDIDPGDGQEITNMWEQDGSVKIAKGDKIYTLSFTVLDPNPDIGDQAVAKTVSGFGVLGIRTLATDGVYATFLAGDGIRLWDGGGRTRLTVNEQSRVISGKIEPIIEQIVRRKTYDKCTGFYHKRNGWYLFSYEDPDWLPRGRPNRTLVYDYALDSWFPFNWSAGSFASQDGPTDNDELLYGDAGDGYIYKADLEDEVNDARQERSIHSMDRASDWLRGNAEGANVLEGTGSLRLSLTPSVLTSSASLMRVFNFGEWPDGARISPQDKLSLKVLPISRKNISSIRVDLEVNDRGSDFDQNFTSVTITSATLTAGDTAWTTVEIALGSFTILSDWTDLASEDFPFAKTQTFYGLRIVMTGVDNSTACFDDIRLVQDIARPMNAYRTSKQFNFGTAAKKRFRQVILNAETSPNTEFFVDIYNDFGQVARRVLVSGGFGKEVFVAGYQGQEGIAKLSSVDFSVRASSYVPSASAGAYRALTDDENFLYAADRHNQQVVKWSKTDFSTFIARAGSLGSGNGQFNNIGQMSVDKPRNLLYATNMLNNRVDALRLDTLSFVKSYGSLGIGSTHYHVPTGVANDASNLFVGDDGNARIVKSDIKTGAFIASAPVNTNTFGYLTLGVTEKHLFDFFNAMHSTAPDYLDVILEKRDKNSLQVESRVRVVPKDYVGISTFNVMGPLALQGNDYVWVSFTDNATGTGRYYVQKRLQSDIAQIVFEYVSDTPIYGIATGSQNFLPGRRDYAIPLGDDGYYLQLRYSETGLDNKFKLNSQTFLNIKEDLKER